jgi:hypothetical protein
MKSTVAALLLAAGSVASAQTITHQTVNPSAVTPVATALNHLSLIELPEPITRAAVGSDDIRIEWHGNTVALKPVRQGQSTNLFVWTEHTQSTYEILAPGDVTSAAFVIDQTDGRTDVSKPVETQAKISETEIKKAANFLIAQAMLQSSAVNSRGVKNSTDHVNVRITEVVRDKDGLVAQGLDRRLSPRLPLVPRPVISLPRFSNSTPQGELPWQSLLVPVAAPRLRSGATTTPCR